jgi:FKBP-type peptidyl-prolyl cis-trans isomerase (trigger factor)
MNVTSEETKQNSLNLTLEIPLEDIEKAKKSALQKLASKTTIKGFRQGKAPIALVEQSLDPDKIKHETLHHLLDSLVPEVVKEKNLTLVGNPQLTNIQDNTGKPWLISLTFPLKPQITLGNYTKLLKTAIDKEKYKFDKLNRDQKIDFFSDTLTKNIEFEIPQSLIDQEIDRSLSRLVEQTQSLGLTIERYLTSINKTAEQLKNDYQTTALNSLKFEFILLEIAKDKKVKITETEIDNFIKAIGDKDLETKFASQSQRTILETILTKRAAIDALLKI